MSCSSRANIADIRVPCHSGTRRAPRRAEQADTVGRAALRARPNVMERNVHQRRRAMRSACLLLLAGALAAGCAHEDFFPGTTILRTEQNAKIIETIEQY